MEAAVCQNWPTGEFILQTNRGPLITRVTAAYYERVAT